MTRQQLIEDNVGLVHYVVRKFYPWRSDDEDIIQVGMIGLIKAADKWDAEKGSFSNFAVICIRGSIASEIKKQLKQVPTVSLDAIINNGDGDTSLLDFQIGSSEIEYVDKPAVYKVLSPPQREVFDKLQLGMTQAEIARDMGISRERVGQHTRKIRLKWQKMMNE
jgi:RNA polymerase sigma factor (sigma-70 family)